MRIGLNDYPKHTSPAEWGELMVRGGYRAATFPVRYDAPVSLIDAYVRVAKELDIRIAEVGVWNSPHHPDPEERRKARIVCEEQFRLAEYVGADCCVNVSGSTGESWPGCYAENFSKALYMENVEFIRGLCERVNPRRTRYALEPMQWMLPDSPEQYLAFLRDVDHPGFGVHMDAVNFAKDPYTYTHMDEVIDRAFDILGPWICSCHLKDCRMDPGITVAIREVPLGEGIMPIRHYLERVAALGRDVPVLLEHLPDMNAYDRAMAVASPIAAAVLAGQ